MDSLTEIESIVLDACKALTESPKESIELTAPEVTIVFIELVVSDALIAIVCETLPEVNEVLSGAIEFEA